MTATATTSLGATSTTRASGPRRRRGLALLAVAGGLSAINGAAHFLLPVLYPWGQHVEGLYEPVRWALYATTFFFGALLLLGGLLTIAVAAATDLPPRVTAWVAGGMAAFWLAGATYEIAVPFPALIASWALPAFSGTVASLYLAGWWLRARPDGAPGEPTAHAVETRRLADRGPDGDVGTRAPRGRRPGRERQQ